jgi:hypothetical protein
LAQKHENLVDLECWDTQNDEYHHVQKDGPVPVNDASSEVFLARRCRGQGQHTSVEGQRYRNANDSNRQTA